MRWQDRLAKDCPPEDYKRLIDRLTTTARDGQGDTMNELDQIVAYENGELESQEVIDLFQSLIDSGMVWDLQGHYQRTAAALIESGLCRTVQEKANA